MVAPIKITVGIGSYFFSSIDEKVWKKTDRKMLSVDSPVISGAAINKDLPIVEGKKILWDYVYLSHSGIGFATGQKFCEDLLQRNSDRITTAIVYKTENFGKNWQPIFFKFRPLIKNSLLVRVFSWWRWGFPSGFNCMHITRDNQIFLIWDDPWPADYQLAHLIFSKDFGELWEYKCLGKNIIPYITKGNDDDNLFILNDGFFLESRTNGNSWEKRNYVIKRPSDLKHLSNKAFWTISFYDQFTGFGLIQHLPDNYSEDNSFIKFELLKTVNGGNDWESINIFSMDKKFRENSKHCVQLLLG